MKALLVIALRSTVAGLQGQSSDAFERSRRLREQEPTDDYELGYAEGRSSALSQAADRISQLADALESV